MGILRGLVPFALLAASLASPAEGQAVEPRLPVLRTELGGRVHIQFNTTSVDGAPRSEFLNRRARIWAAARINDWIDGAALIGFSGSVASARYAFIRFAPVEHTRISVGQFKRPFDLFEMTSSADILVVERDGQIRDVGSCTGVGGMCSFSRFSEQLQLASLDIGMLVDGETADGRLAYLLSVTNGTGGNTREDNNAKSVSGRLAWSLTKRLNVGANLVMHDFANPVTTTDTYAPALGVDAEWGNFASGLHVQAGVMGGENWKNLDGAGDGSRFLTLQAIATYKVRIETSDRVEAIEPLGRISWGDPDRTTLQDGGLLVTPGLAVHFDGRTKLAANADFWRPQAGASHWGLKVQTYLYF